MDGQTSGPVVPFEKFYGIDKDADRSYKVEIVNQPNQDSSPYVTPLLIIACAVAILCLAVAAKHVRGMFR